jgi:siroheme synthase (precorrin-2 oxidase/ferrochelatase)
MAVNFSDSTLRQHTEGLAKALSQHLEREIRAHLQTKVDEIVRESVSALHRQLHVMTAQQHNDAFMQVQTILRVDGVETARLPNPGAGR